MNPLELNHPCLYPTVFFGEYIIPNAGKPIDIFVRFSIEWLVVEKDLIKKKALLVSRYAVDWEGFANCPLIGSGYETSWETSYLRKWLNEDFYNDSFSEAEKNIISTVCDTTGESAKGVSDKVFLLSVDEIKKYFKEENSAAASELLIDKLTASGTQDNPIEISCYPTFWWTRTSGKTKDRVMCVDKYGELFEIDSNCDEVGVRPAIWVNI